MKFEQIFSSSKGNLYLVTAANGKKLLLECGVTWAKLQKALAYDLNDIEACFVTHEHKDHSKAVIDVMGAGIDVYASAGTLASWIEENCPQHRRAKIIKDKDLVRLTDFQVFCFPLNHDALEPLGFIVRAITENEYLLFAPDTSLITQRFMQVSDDDPNEKQPRKFNIIAIEVSYDKDILQQRVDTNDINEALAKRLLTSHMEKSTAMDYLGNFCDRSKLREIHLLHLSADNIEKEKTRQEFEDKFEMKTIVI